MPEPFHVDDSVQDKASTADYRDEDQGALQRFRDQFWSRTDEPDVPRRQFRDENSGSQDSVKNAGSGVSPEEQLRKQLDDASFRPTEVDQGSVGDCFFMAALTSLANTEPGRQTIKDMITINSDGSYTVRFKGDKDHAIEVSDDDIKQLGITNGAKWADIVETAFLKYTHDRPLADILKQSGIGLLARVRNTRDAIHLLTGQEVATDQFSLISLGSQQLTVGETSRENVARDLEWAMKNQSVVTVGVSPEFARFIGGNNPGPVPAGHVYAVMDFDPVTHTVTVRNPWGHNANSPLAKEGETVSGITNIGEGKLCMSLDTFMSRFTDLNISGRNEVQHSAEHLGRDMTRTLGKIIDVGEDLIEGRPGRTPGDLVRTVASVEDTRNQMVYAATNLIWMKAKSIAGNPVELMLPAAAKVSNLFR